MDPRAPLIALQVGTVYFGVECPGCGHRVVFQTDELTQIGTTPRTDGMRDILKKMRCGYCKRLGATGMPLKDMRWANEWRKAARNR